MAKVLSHSSTAFTLLEILMAIGVTLVVAAVAVPAIGGSWSREGADGRLGQLDGMVREAHRRSAEERRTYSISYGRDGVVRLRPEPAADEAEAKGLRRLGIGKTETLKIEFPFALTRVDTDHARWTFWQDGTCEPVRVQYSGVNESWTVSYNPLTCRREVRHD